MPRSFFARALILLGLLPVAGWLAFATQIEPSGFGRGIGIALLVVLTPLPVGGLLLAGGGWGLRRRPKAARIVATVGAALLGLAPVPFVAAWGWRFAGCIGGGGCGGELLPAAIAFAYAASNVVLIVLLWRRSRGADT